MSLTNRLSLFFLVALALVLCGFSVILYALAHRHLNAQVDHRLDATMQTLVAAIEVHPGDVEWEPLERKVAVGDDPAPDQVRWTIHDPAGRLVDCSPNLDRGASVLPTDRGWRVLARRVRSGQFDAEPFDGRPRPFEGGLGEAFPAGQPPGAVTLPADRTFHGDALVLTVALAEAPVRETLAQLAGTLAAVSGLVWLTAAVWGRWLCRQALRPITRMAASARTLRRESDPGLFLDVAESRDELEDLGRAFNDLLVGIREALERQQRFTGDASHQLRTPLTALLTSVEVALKRERSPAEYQRVLGVVQRRGTQLRQIIDSLLFLARAEATPLPEPEAIDLGEWCRAWLAGWSEHARAADLTVRADAPARVCTHPALLGQILDNLLDNACKYSDPGTPVTVAVGAGAGGVTLTVIDRGCGIAADELSRVFEPFYRAGNARWLGKPGVGLGLAVVWRLAAILGGRVEVGSEPGQGSRFRLSLPQAAEGPQPGGTGGTNETAQAWSAGRPGPVAAEACAGGT
ncbi:MAG: HAMP domain-containing protein [Planctomycetes bacterium]|nr:HAMP domain-containing protein [Planctomycetota bacterium]